MAAYTQSGMIFLSPGDNLDAVVDFMLDTNYNEEFCLALDWGPDFIAGLIQAGFLVMSERVALRDEQSGRHIMETFVLPKLHLLRSILFFDELRVKKSVRRFLPRYELRFDSDFNAIVQNCVHTHGDYWLTPALLGALYALRADARSPVRPVSFGVYREGRLIAGEFGVISGRVYTSYSGYHSESNSGTVQMILMTRWLAEAGFSFLDFGMPLDYKTDLGARNISPEAFVRLFRAAQT
jgi:Leu/Phe-tRNA-protein transferase